MNPTTSLPLAGFDLEHILRIAASVGIDASDHESQKYLLAIGPVDVQAAPGSGKTTLTGLKVAALLSTWRSRTSGICVLSHTNTARNEIEDVVSRCGRGSVLRQSPHFVGTIQSFVSVFGAHQYLHRRNIFEPTVDDELYARKLRSLVGQYRSLRTALQFSDATGQGLSSTRFVWSVEQATLEVHSKALAKAGENSASWNELRALKQQVSKLGFFRYDDMYALAEAEMTAAGWRLDALRRRFPFVLIDEMQDTSVEQEAVLGRLLGSQTIVQRVGDRNQRIFKSDNVETSTFPHDGCLTLATSRRFGDRIAEVCQLVGEKAAISGAGSADGRVFLIVFDSSTIGMVIPAFAQLATDQLPFDAQLTNSKVIGARRRRGAARIAPQSIQCFLAATETAGGSDVAVHRPWLGYLTIWGRIAGYGRTHFGLAWDGLGLLRECESREPDQALSARRSFVRDAAGAEVLSIASSIASRVLGATIPPLHPVSLSYDEDDLGSESANDAEDLPPNITVLTGRRAVTIGVDTIHNSKGETHDATLVLECVDRSGSYRDIGRVLFVSLGGKRKTVNPEVRRLLYVAASRPRRVLGLAIYEESFSDLKLGSWPDSWEVVDLRGSG